MVFYLETCLNHIFLGLLSTIAVFYGNPGGVQLCEATCVANFSFFPIIVISCFHFFKSKYGYHYHVLLYGFHVYCMV